MRSGQSMSVVALLLLLTIYSGQAVFAANPPLQADFTFSSQGLAAIFTDTSVGDPVSWRWDFGDGTAPSADREPVHKYTEAGTYLVTLTVTTAKGRDTDTRRQFVPINSPRPVADFTFTVQGLAVAFTDTSTGNPISWSWDFGDDSSSSEQEPVHTYDKPGTYTVILTVANLAGDTADTVREVAIIRDREHPATGVLLVALHPGPRVLRVAATSPHPPPSSLPVLTQPSAAELPFP